MNESAPMVFVVDDDLSIRTALGRLLRSVGMQVMTFPSAAAFLEHQRPESPSCLVLDVQMPELDGLELQNSLRLRRVPLPIIFITGQGDIPMSVGAMKAGAFDFLPKPVHDEVLLDAVRQAIAQDKRNRERGSNAVAIQQRLTQLSPREREVLEHVVAGKLNKQIGRRLGVTEKTIKVHRGHVMHKMQARSLAELVRMAGKVGIDGPRDRQTATALD